MKIDHNAANRLTPNGTESASNIDKKTVTASADQQANRLAGKDQASLSEQARLLAKVHSVLEETDVQRSERVEALKAQIVSGNYEIPINELAKRLADRFKLIE